MKCMNGRSFKNNLQKDTKSMICQTSQENIKELQKDKQKTPFHILKLRFYSSPFVKEGIKV